MIGDHFDAFIANQLKDGCYGSASEVIRQGLRLLEEHEQKVEALRQSIIEGEESGNAGVLDMEEIRLEVKRKAGLSPPNA